MSSKPEGLRVDLRVKRTRLALKQAMMALLSEKSYEAITIQDIAERAMVNRVTFYAHYPDKQALMEQTSRELIKERLYRQVPEGTPFSPANLARLIQTVCEFIAEMNNHCSAPHGQMDQWMEKQCKAVICDRLQDWTAATAGKNGHNRPSPNQAAVAASWAIYGVAVQWSESVPRVPAVEFVQQVLPIILAGLRLDTKN